MVRLGGKADTTTRSAATSCWGVLSWVSAEGADRKRIPLVGTKGRYFAESSSAFPDVFIYTCMSLGQDRPATHKRQQKTLTNTSRISPFGHSEHYGETIPKGNNAIG